MEKPENTFAKNLLSKLDKSIFYEKTSNAMRRGMPDYYIEGPKDIAWIEMKWIEKTWVADKEPSKVCSSSSWVNQRHWLERAHKNGKQAYAIVGIGKGRGTMCYVLEFPYAFSLEHTLHLTLEQTAAWIETKTL